MGHAKEWVYLIASSILDSRRVFVTSLNSSRHSSLVGASIPMLPYAPMSIRYFFPFASSPFWLVSFLPPLFYDQIFGNRLFN
jgi:hypothetical protein